MILEWFLLLWGTLLSNWRNLKTFENLTVLMAPHSSTLAWKIPWMEEPGRLQSMGSRRVRHLLSDFTFTFHFHALEEEMATNSSVLAWRIPGTGEPGGLPSMGSHRVRHDWSDLAVTAAESVDNNSTCFIRHQEHYYFIVRHTQKHFCLSNF